MSIFKIDSTSLLMREYVRRHIQVGNTSTLQIKTADAYDDFIDININTSIYDSVNKITLF